MTGHWASNMECPNYLAKQRAKTVELPRSKAGGNTGGVVAIRNNSGTRS
jgi:hypothetical protein